MNDTWRYYIVDQKTGIKFCVEPISGNNTSWGDINQVTKKITGSYGKKHKGCIDLKESIITDENGF